MRVGRVDVSRVRTLGPTADGRPREDGRSRLSDDRAPLTQRQLEILHLLAQGRTTGEITTELDLSRTTVRNHIANLLAALGAHSRLQAVLIARRTGILEM